MLKYTTAQVTFAEVPGEITLCINISNCPRHCKGCHSPYLQNNIGKILDFTELHDLITKNDGITCICFMGGDNDLGMLSNLIYDVHNNTNLKVAWYTGSEEIPNTFLKWLDYVKIGPYNEELGGLNNPATNQRFYKVSYEDNNQLEDITYVFWDNTHKTD